ncbi:hypothetical protein K438DRAFT_1983310 [Mycena galopus ATCC 62051]|nr:hypothetical protein K438DRAFT_1983310 [Mycena galopus ATCC 62051]
MTVSTVITREFLYPVAIPSTSLLFFFRVRAIYGGARKVIVVFGLMLAVVSNTATALMVGLPAVRVTYRSLLVVPNLMLTSVMACRLYRHT